MLGAALATWAGAPQGRYAISADTVLDTKTMLTWQRNVPATIYTLANAATYCQNLNLSGTGWRLPTVKELMSLVDARAHTPSIDTAAFPNTPLNYFWSSTIDAQNTSKSWVVYFDGGYSNRPFTPNNGQVRCVR